VQRDDYRNSATGFTQKDFMVVLAEFPVNIMQAILMVFST